MTKNGEDWGKFIVAKGFKQLPKVQNIAQSGHSAHSRFSALPTNLDYIGRYFWVVEQPDASKAVFSDHSGKPSLIEIYDFRA